MIATLEAAYARIDRQTGGHNQVSLFALRCALDRTRKEVDDLIAAACKSGRFFLEQAERQLTPEEWSGSIIQHGQTMAYIGRRSN